MKVLTQHYLISASVENVWKALTDEKLIEQWSDDKAKMDDKAGTKFSIWGGSIWGENLLVVKNKKLVQSWFSDDKEWEDMKKQQLISIVIFYLHQEGDKTELELIHEGIPAADYDNIANGWSDYYLGPLKKFAESL
jgi:activator of HSP90 ATPase